ncbi:hypothetical protein ABW20_dc0101074 [Dactylellina cionopaga]|nr:hypothetical protein ABW20_dc0101074 [Dactylellina cionopaga]
MAAPTLASSTPVYLFTFNCGREFVNPQLIVPNLFSALNPASPPPEIVAIGLQEVAPISYSFIGGEFIEAYLDQWRSIPNLAAQSLHKINPNFPSEYVEIGRHAVGMTALLLFSNKPEKIRALRFAGVGFGVWGMGNKGGAAARFLRSADGGDKHSLDDDSNVDITIVSAHLSAHEHCCADRNRDWETLARGIVFDPPSTGAHLTTDELTPLLQDLSPATSSVSGIYNPGSHLLVMGDLNYRTSSTAPNPTDFKTFPRAPEDLPDYFAKDQLNIERAAGNTLHGLVEAEIRFPPTYKYLSTPSVSKESTSASEDSSSSKDKLLSPELYAYAPHRWPAWCDRILWLPVHSSPSSDVIVHKYTSIHSITFSDHRPVGLHVSLPSIRRTAKDAGGDGKGDLRKNPPFPVDTNWRSKRYQAEIRELAAGYAILMVTTVGGVVVIGCVVVSLGMLWWAINGRVG